MYGNNTLLKSYSFNVKLTQLLIIKEVFTINEIVLKRIQYPKGDRCNVSEELIVLYCVKIITINSIIHFDILNWNIH